jgi:hypothetical protein
MECFGLFLMLQMLQSFSETSAKPNDIKLMHTTPLGFEDVKV